MSFGNTGLITALYLSLFAIFYLYLSLRVVFFRWEYRQEIGDGHHPQLERAIRTQANANEYGPLTFLLMYAVELSVAPVWLLHLVGISFLVARLLHFLGFGFKVGVSFERFWGTVITYLIILTLSLYCIFNAMLYLLTFYG